MIQMRMIISMASGRVHTGVWSDTDLPSATAWLENQGAQVEFLGDLLAGGLLRAEVEAVLIRPREPGLRTRTLFLRTAQIEDIEVQIREMRVGTTTTVVEPTDEPEADVLG